MEITGSFHPPAPYTNAAQAENPSRPRTHSDEQNQQISTPIQQVAKPQQNGFEHNRKRFNTQEKDLSHSVQQAINHYIDSDFAGGPELMNRIDVFA